jgi:hypothetical protein
MLGDCPPVNTERKRVPPIIVFNKTLPTCSAVISPIIIESFRIQLFFIVLRTLSVSSWDALPPLPRASVIRLLVIYNSLVGQNEVVEEHITDVRINVTVNMYDRIEVIHARLY